MDIAMILTKNYSNCKWSLDGDNYSGLNWFDELPKPSEKELLKQWNAVAYELALDTVKRNRFLAYSAPGGSAYFLNINAARLLSKNGLMLSML